MEQHSEFEIQLLPFLWDKTMMIKIVTNGMFRCCIQYLEESENEISDKSETQCKYCKASLVKVKNAWKWDSEKKHA
jgi:hypothetical protein